MPSNVPFLSESQEWPRGQKSKALLPRRRYDYENEQPEEKGSGPSVLASAVLSSSAEIHVQSRHERKQIGCVTPDESAKQKVKRLVASLDTGDLPRSFEFAGGRETAEEEGGSHLESLTDLQLSLGDLQLRRGLSPAPSAQRRKTTADLHSLENFRKATSSGADVCVCAAAKYSERERVQVRQIKTKLKEEFKRLQRTAKRVFEERERVQSEDSVVRQRLREMNGRLDILSGKRSELEEFATYLQAEEDNLRLKGESIGMREERLMINVTNVDTKIIESDEWAARQQANLKEERRDFDDEVADLERRKLEVRNQERDMEQQRAMIEKQKRENEQVEFDIRNERTEFEEVQSQRNEELGNREKLLARQEADVDSLRERVAELEAEIDELLKYRKVQENRVVVAVEAERLMSEAEGMLLELQGEKQDFEAWRAEEEKRLEVWESDIEGKAREVGRSRGDVSAKLEELDGKLGEIAAADIDGHNERSQQLELEEMSIVARRERLEQQESVVGEQLDLKRQALDVRDKELQAWEQELASRDRQAAPCRAGRRATRSTGPPVRSISNSPARGAVSGSGSSARGGLEVRIPSIASPILPPVDVIGSLERRFLANVKASQTLKFVAEERLSAATPCSELSHLGVSQDSTVVVEGLQKEKQRYDLVETSSNQIPVPRLGSPMPREASRMEDGPVSFSSGCPEDVSNPFFEEDVSQRRPSLGPNPFEAIRARQRGRSVTRDEGVRTSTPRTSEFWEGGERPASDGMDRLSREVQRIRLLSDNKNV